MRKNLLVPVILSLIPSVLLCARDATDGGVKQGTAAPSAPEIRRMIHAKGAKAALTDLTSDTEKWNGVLDKMAQGEQEWLALVIELYKVADGGAALDLGIVSAEALATAPKRVLEMLEPVVGLDTLCQNDASVGLDFQVAVRKIGARRSAVTGIRDVKLAEKRLRCLTMLETLEKDIRAAKDRGDMN